MLNYKQQFFKRLFDLALSTILLLPSILLIGLIAILLAIRTMKFPFFIQKRIGKGGKVFKLIKIRTLFIDDEIRTFPPEAKLKLARFIRRTKLDELPQILLIWVGQMSFVGPRPDLPGYLDSVEKKYQKLWTLKPGLTGPATLKYKNEDEILLKQNHPKQFNDQVIWADKLVINLAYFENYSFWSDLNILIKSVTK
ncbi:sugar transferase [Flavobacteriaceae bacterium]|nr:sugar transferase [Flavobacteriaceae bacterium]